MKTVRALSIIFSLKASTLEPSESTRICWSQAVPQNAKATRGNTIINLYKLATALSSREGRFCRASPTRPTQITVPFGSFSRCVASFFTEVFKAAEYWNPLRVPVLKYVADMLGFAFCRRLLAEDTQGQRLRSPTSRRQLSSGGRPRS